MSMKKIIAGAAVALSLVAHAFEAPRTVTVTTGFGPGSGNEVSFRAVAAIVEKTNPATSYVVLNRPGADEVVALNWFTKLPPRGDNLYITSHQGVFTAIDHWYPDQIKFNPFDMEFVTTIAKSPLAVVAHINSPTNTPQELLARIKNTREPITFGLGAGAHKLVFEYLMDKGQGNRELVRSVMYKGPAQAVTDVAGNQVEFGILPTAVAYGLVKGGKVKYIALAGEQRLARIPDVPLWQETVPGLNVYAAWAIAMPPGTPRSQVDHYNRQFVAAIRSAEAKQFFDENLMFTVPAEHTPEGVRKHLIELRKKWFPYVQKMKFD
jgi:tripartite-type tricarboxylate transporter receptor subunit TctC